MSAPLRSLAGLAWRESRTARRRLFLYMSSISLGVAALVAIDSFAGNVTRSIREQSRALLGGDLSFSARQAFPPAADSLLDSLRTAGIPIARVTSFASMAVSPRTERTRLAQIRAVSDGYPFYGVVETKPAGRWAQLQQGHEALLDPSLLLALGADVGDSITLGRGRFRIAGTLLSVPGDVGIASAIAPRIFIAERWVPETQLIVFGSRAEYEAVARLPEGASPNGAAKPLRARLEGTGVRLRTVTQREMDLTDAVDTLGDFLGLVGLVALLLGGIGVASGVHAFVARKIDTVAVLRCLGATSGQVLAIYATQAALMGLAGAAVGAALGVAVQFALPMVMADVLPVNVSVHLEPRALLVRTRHRALGGTRLRAAAAARAACDLAVAGAAPHGGPVGAAAAVGRLAAAARRRADRRHRAGDRLGARGQSGARARDDGGDRPRAARPLARRRGGWPRVARGLVRSGWPYVLRQGVANLYAPGEPDARRDARPRLRRLPGDHALPRAAEPARALRDHGGLGARERGLLRRAGRSGGRARLAGARERRARGAAYADRHHAHRVGERSQRRGTARRHVAGAVGDPARVPVHLPQAMVPTEKLVAGRWFDADPDTTRLPQVSFERDVATELGVQLGDTVTWDVQGAPVPTRVTSLREVNWAQFEPNFFAVFEPRAIAAAPAQFVLLVDADSGLATARVQQQAVQRLPNVSSIDLSLVRRTIDDVVGKVRAAVRFLAIFSLAMAVPVLLSAVSATQRERVREGVLLKTLGATRTQIRRILLAEYALLGVLGCLTGAVLAYGGAWAVMRWVFDSPFTPVVWPVVAIAAAMIALATTIGLLGGRDVLAEPPLAALREA